LFLLKNKLQSFEKVYLFSAENSNLRKQRKSYAVAGCKTGQAANQELERK